MSTIESYLISLDEGIRDKYPHIKFLGKYDITVEPGDTKWKTKIKEIERNFTKITRKISKEILPLYKKQCLKIEVNKSKCNVSHSDFVKMIPISHISFFNDGKIEGCKILFKSNNLFENPFISITLNNISNPNASEVSLEG